MKDANSNADDIDFGCARKSREPLTPREEQPRPSREHLELVLTETTRELQQSEERYRALFETLPVGVVLQDADGRIVAANPSASVVLRLSLDQILGRTSTDPSWRALREDGSPFPGEEHPAMVSLATGRPQHGVVMALGEESRRTWISINSCPLFREGEDKPYAVISSFADITPVKQAQLAHKIAQEKLEKFVAYAPVALAMFDRKMRYVATSRKWRTAAGLARDPLPGTLHYDLFPNLPHSFLEAHRRGLSGEAVNGEDEYVRADGRTVRVRWEVRPWGDAGEETGGIIIFSDDVTEARALETQLRSAQKMEAVGRLAGGVAHEFRNALCVILLNLTLAKDEMTAGSDASRELDAIHHAAGRAQRIVDNLLAFSRKREFAPQSFVLGRFVEEIEKVLRPLAGKGVEFTILNRAGNSRVFFDPMQLEQVVINLVMNAVDSMSGSGRLTIETTSAADLPQEAPDAQRYVALSVVDTGAGIRPEDLPLIFEPYYTTKEVGKGTGLGLSISYGIISQGGGQIQVHSVPGEGTRFDLLLPVG